MRRASINARCLYFSSRPRSCSCSAGLIRSHLAILLRSMGRTTRNIGLPRGRCTSTNSMLAGLSDSISPWYVLPPCKTTRSNGQSAAGRVDDSLGALFSSAAQAAATICSSPQKTTRPSARRVSHTNPTRKRGFFVQLPSLARRVSVGQFAENLNLECCRPEGAFNSRTASTGCLGHLIPAVGGTIAIELRSASEMMSTATSTIARLPQLVKRA